MRIYTDTSRPQRDNIRSARKYLGTSENSLLPQRNLLHKRHIVFKIRSAKHQLRGEGFRSNRIESRRTRGVIDKKVKVPARESPRTLAEHASQTFVNRHGINPHFFSLRAPFAHVGQRRDVSLSSPLSSFVNSLRETGTRFVAPKTFRGITLQLPLRLRVFPSFRYVSQQLPRDCFQDCVLNRTE